MANSKLHDDFVNEFESLEDTKASVTAMLHALADRIEVSKGNVVKLTDLKTILREDPDKVAKAVLANTPAAKNRTRTTQSFDAPSAAFEKPREGVRDGMASQNDHRDQQFPATSRTEAEREMIKREQVAHGRGDLVAVNVDMPNLSDADKKVDADAKKKTAELQRGKR